MLGLRSISKRHLEAIDETKCEADTRSARIDTVGGHNENFSSEDGFLTKKTNHTEARFYRRLMTKELGLAQFMPKCTIIKDGISDPAGSAEITMEDLRREFQSPLIYDIKLGTKTMSSKELALSGSRRSSILRKGIRLHVADTASSSAKRGYRFVGSSASTESRMHLAKHPDEMIKDIGDRLTARDLAIVIDELEALLLYLQSKEGRRFELIGASVLIVAESDPFILKTDSSSRPKVKLIDFAHSNLAGINGLVLDNGLFVTPQRKRTYQRGFKLGLKNLSDDLRAVLEEKQTR